MLATNKGRLLLVGLVIFLDQISKILVLRYYPSLASINHNGSFSLAWGVDYLYVSIISLLIFLIAIYYLEREISKKIGFVFIVSGGISNVIDRIRLDGVVDFLHSPFWPTFNIADSFITIGAIIIIIELIIQRVRKAN